IGISGASGVIYGIRALEMLKGKIESHLILSPAAKATIAQETDYKVSDVIALASVNHDHRDVGASIASGSFVTMGMLIAPCSIKTLSAVANSFSADLMVRAADVCLKEGRPLLLMVRETPLHRGHIRLMAQAAESGAIIFPPTPAFYSKPKTIDDIVNGTVGRALARLGIENEAYTEWKGMKGNKGNDGNEEE
ncbi:MAG: UbiX family flavin prenyltransferase, partial [Chloroflexi bacterium]|nr:UbiX family flavin prenyltransferase [Chloroflexota bacterium]